jgi:hypothetical protein
MGVDSFDAAGRRDRLAAQLAELEAATALSPKLAAQLAELSASLEACRQQLPALGPVAEASQAWVREMGRDALRDWRRGLDRRQQLDAALIELAAERRQRATGGEGQQPAPAAPPPALAIAPAPAPALQVITPEGGKWPHAHRAPWTDAERVALFKMRHVQRISRGALARIAGVSGPRIDELIGGATVLKQSRPTWPKDWQPSAELLRECRAPLQPLQVVATTLQGDRPERAASSG